jgi:DNA invertase Pin-like site-specific DNA recombinase
MRTHKPSTAGEPEPKALNRPKPGVIRHADAKQREKQASRVVRIIEVHRLFRKYGLDTGGSIAKIAEDLGVSERTVHRDKLVLKAVYAQLGKETLE